jgi:hypothetical protein
MRRFGGGPPINKKVFTCPQCGKHRMSRPMNHCVSKETQEFKTRDGSTVSLFLDTCDNCVAKNYRDHFEPTKSDVRKVLKAMNEEATASGDVSLEELL